MAAQRSLVLCLLLLLPTFAVPIHGQPSRGIRIELTHVDARGDLMGSDRVCRAADRRRRRVSGLLAAVSPPTASTLRSDGGAMAAASMHASTATYLVDLAIGTPPLALSAVLDTGSDLIWAQCDTPCRRCFPQPAPLYVPARSATYANLSCGSRLCQALPSLRPSSRCSASASASTPERGCAYYFSYGDGSSTDGILTTESFTFGAGTTIDGLPLVAARTRRCRMDADVDLLLRRAKAVKGKLEALDRANAVSRMDATTLVKMHL